MTNLLDIVEIWLEHHHWTVIPLAILFGMSPFWAAWCEKTANDLEGKDTPAWIRFLAG